MIIIPIICGLLFWLGGREQMNIPFNQKLFRWIGIGLWIALCTFSWTLIPLCIVIAYFLSTNIIGYGESHILRKWFGKDTQWIIYGFFFGLSSCFGLYLLCLFQTIISIISVYTLLKWSNDGFQSLPYIGNKIPKLYGNKINQELVEFLIGFFGTILYIFI